MDNQLSAKLKYLRLCALHAHWDDYLQEAAKRRFSHDRLLKHVVEQEYRAKLERVVQRRMKQAKIPEMYVMETYPFSKQPTLNKKKVLAYYDSFEFIDKARNITWFGPTGCGKTGLATSFLVKAVESGYTARFVMFKDLIDELFHSVADHSEPKVLKRYLSYDVLLIDEFGYVEIEPVQVGLFFTLMHKRYKKKSTMITSNLGFSEWAQILHNPQLTAALCDRLTDGSHVITMKNGKTLRDGIEE